MLTCFCGFDWVILGFYRSYWVSPSFPTVSRVSLSLDLGWSSWSGFLLDWAKADRFRCGGTGFLIGFYCGPMVSAVEVPQWSTIARSARRRERIRFTTVDSGRRWPAQVTGALRRLSLVSPLWQLDGRPTTASRTHRNDVRIRFDARAGRQSSPSISLAKNPVGP